VPPEKIRAKIQAKIVHSFFDNFSGYPGNKTRYRQSENGSQNFTNFDP